MRSYQPPELPLVVEVPAKALRPNPGEAIPEPALRVDIPRVSRVVAELVAQSRDMDLQEHHVLRPIKTPDPAENCLVAQDMARVEDQM